ncbi:MAG TPA: response regulator [Thermoanaerobaculia bacterium]
MPASERMTSDVHKRVLVVDDDDEVRKILTAALVRHGLDVDYAYDGEQALALLREQTYAVVLLDLLMPNMDGFSVLDVLNTDSMQSPPVVLVLTGADNSVVDRLNPQRIHGLVRKPFDPQDLAALVVACSDIKRRGTFEAMALATMVSGAPLLAWLNRFGG